MPPVPGIPPSLPLLPSAGSLAPAPAVPTTSAPSLHPGCLQSVSGLLPPVSQSQGLILSSALEPIPARLVGRITSGQFIEMRDLLTDNIALHNQLEALQGTYHLTTLPNSIRPRVREVPSLISWVYCFVAYVATCTSDTQTRDMLTIAGSSLGRHSGMEGLVGKSATGTSVANWQSIHHSPGTPCCQTSRRLPSLVNVLAGGRSATSAEGWIIPLPIVR